MHPYSDSDFLSVLNQYWGYDTFRPAQLEIIRSVASGHDTIGLLPTGGGKSITYQVPAMLSDGLTVVVTPLISLMKDQVDNLRDRDIRAVFIHSGLTRREVNLALDRCRLGKTRLLYVSPERLQSKSFIDEARFFDIRLIVVDEAHCISQWGYDFRPSYLKIPILRKHFPGIPILALTASATPEVISDIAAKLEMQNPAIHKLSFSRDNISYVVRYSDYKEGEIVNILSRVPGTAIVYVRSRARTRQIADILRREGISADFYHAGLHTQDKDERQNRWKEGSTRVIVATNAFGMGIDKPDVRVVIHYDLPSSLEEYYQEAGRAGRDGLQSFAVLLASNADKGLLTRRLNDSFPPRETIRRVYESVGNFFELPVGEGFNQVFEFNLQLFCTRFKFMPAIVHNSLMILTQAGYIEYNDEMSFRSRIMMIMKRDELYSLQLAKEPERVLQFILRSTTGIFADYQHINESLIASSLDYTEQTVYEALLLLTRLNVLHYVPKKNASFIFYTTSREEPQHVLIPIAVYDDRRRRMEQRIEAMKRFAFADDDCRVNTMLRYFGEETAAPCGKCDVCRSRNRNPQAEQIVAADIETIVLRNLSVAQRELTVDEVVKSIGAKADKVIKAIRKLADAGKVGLTPDGRITLRND